MKRGLQVLALFVLLLPLGMGIYMLSLEPQTVVRRVKPITKVIAWNCQARPVLAEADQAPAIELQVQHVSRTYGADTQPWGDVGATVLRANSPEGPFAEIATSSGTQLAATCDDIHPDRASFLNRIPDRDVQPGRWYFYMLKIDLASKVVSARAPYPLTVSAAYSNGSLHLSWNAPSQLSGQRLIVGAGRDVALLA